VFRYSNQPPRFSRKDEEKRSAEKKLLLCVRGPASLSVIGIIITLQYNLKKYRAVSLF